MAIGTANTVTIEDKTFESTMKGNRKRAA